MTEGEVGNYFNCYNSNINAYDLMERSDKKYTKGRYTTVKKLPRRIKRCRCVENE